MPSKNLISLTLSGCNFPFFNNNDENKDDDDENELTTVTSLYDELKNGFLKGHNILLLHGRMKASEKEEVMNKLDTNKDGKVDKANVSSEIEIVEF